MIDDLNPESIAALLELEARVGSDPWTIVDETTIYAATEELPEYAVTPIFEQRGRDPYRRHGKQYSHEQMTDIAALAVASRNLIRPLAKAYLAGQRNAALAKIEALEGMREWHLAEQSHAALHRSPLAMAHAEAIKEINRRIAELRSAS